MHSVRTKICGIKNPEVAAAACHAGADAIGLMFYPPSPRHLEIDQAIEVRRGVAPFSVAIAVMVNPDPDFVREMIQQVGVDRLQFHGEEDDEFCASFGLPFIKVLRVAADSRPAQAIREYPSSSGFLLDTHVPGLYGGAGKSFDWELARFDCDRPVILAGGLNPDNVGDAIRTVAPYGVDVSSGVESDGVKDTDKIIAFCAAVRSVQTAA